MSAKLRLYSLLNREKIFSVVRSFLEKKGSALPRELFGQISDYSFRKGKYVRPVSIVLFGQALGVRPGSLGDLRYVAAVYQLLTDWGLAEDDILDSGETRRGGPALHVKYGLDFAVNAMDLLHSYFFDMLYERFRRRPALYDRLYSVFRDATELTLTGQYLDIKARRKDIFDFTEKDYFEILKHKTGYMTGSIPLRISAIFSDSGIDLRSVEKFGVSIGVAYQLRDDILDMDVKERNERLFSKPYGNDVYEGKRTILLSDLLAACGSAERKRIASVYAKRKEEKSRRDVEYVVRLMYEKGAIARAKARLSLLQDGISGIYRRSILPFLCKKYGGLYTELLSFCLERKY